MKLVTLTWPISQKLGDIKAIELIKNAGFDGYDFSMFCMKKDDCILNSAKSDEYIEAVKKYADEIKLPCLQAHAPFPTAKESDEESGIILERVIHSIEIAGYLGADVIVVHPNDYKDIYRCREEIYEDNMEFYNKLIPYAKRSGIKIAIENMWNYDKKRGVIYDSVCSHAEEFNRYIDGLNSEYITACLDVGHCTLVSDSPEQMIDSMGNRIGALHIHDNDCLNDSHTVPYAGKIDWDRVCSALNKTGYSGHFTFETDAFFSKLDAELIPAGLKYLESIGRHLLKKIEYDGK